MRNKAGFSLIEYCVTFALMVTVLVLMVPYITGAIAGRIRSATQDIAPQYHPGRTSTSSPNRLAVELTREEKVFEASDVTKVSIPSLKQDAFGKPFQATHTTGVTADNARQSVVVTTSNQTITQERHESSNDVVGRPSVP